MAAGDSGAAARIDRAARAVEGITRLAAYVGIGALLVAIGLVVVDVVWRRIGDQSLIGAVDLTQLCVMAAAFLSIPHAFSRGAHVVVDLFAAVFPAWLARCLDAAAAALSFALLALILYLSWGRAMEQMRYGDVSQDLAIPMIWYWGFVLVGCALSLLATLVAFLQHATGGEAPRDAETV